MKKLTYLIALLAFFAGCSDDDNNVNLSVSHTELIFSPEKGEQFTTILSDQNWDCEYDAEWLLVRQQQNGIRVIADENTNKEERFSVIKITANGSIQHEIRVTQAGTEIYAESSSISAISKGETIFIPVTSNVQWDIKNENEWLYAKKVDNKLELNISRNYSMDERSGILILKSGNVSQTITISQSGCEWFESFEMIEVKAGTFYMGAQKDYSNETNYDASAYQIESPVHEVTINTFCIGKYEVTQTQWFAAMGNNPSNIQGENLPVENVTWEEVQAFISILNEVSGMNYRLPSEAEWEFAAKGGIQSNGSKFSGSTILGTCGWYYTNSGSKTHEVGSKEPNELGIFDMSGNVREWCNDWFDYYDSYKAENPQGPSTGSTKINRGGSWTTPAVNCRNTYRHTDYPSDSYKDLGFRLVLTI